MALPIFEEFLYPFLLATSKKDMTISEMREYIVDYFHLTEEDCSLRTKSGNTTQVADRLIWVRQYLRRALMMARSIKRYLEYNVNACEVLVFKGKKQISITRRSLDDKHFFQTFIRRYSK